jgi:hypothetical protein
MKTNSLDNLRVASPCPTNWESMQGDDKVRHCELCNLNVYNISALSRREAAALITRSEGRLCARLYRRADGTVITKDCPVGLRAIRRRAARMTAAAFAALVTLATCAFGQKKDKTSCRQQVTITKNSNQTTNGMSAVTGAILDPNGAVIPGAGITLSPQSNLNPIKTVTDNEGKFTVSGLESGTYKITVEAAGFKKVQLLEVKLASRETVSVEAILLLKDSYVTVGIIGEPSLIDRPLGTFIIDQKMIQNLPIHED